MRRRFCSYLAICLVLLLNLTYLSAADDIQFGRDVQPILAEHCFACHGPDENQRQADLRLDQQDGLMSVVDLESPSDSQMLLRVHSADRDEQMPPPEFNKPLNDQQKNILLTWIQGGASWQEHWAFQSIQRPEPPVDPTGWARGPIDQFLVAKMQQHGLKPSPMASPATRLRRVYFDLVGTAPTPSEVDAFVKDADSGEWERAIDRLFQSPHYGERMAVGWLDLARYADTNGYQNDFVRSMWPWRNWVIQAFNEKMSFDQFIIQQMAGDMLPEPNESQLIATGFHRNNHSVTEGGSIEEEWRIENCIDRLETTSATFLGLTMGCARCHDHKYDPVSQREFYQFFAFFNNVDEKGVYNEFRGNTQPLLKVPTEAQKAALAKAELQLEQAKKKLAAAVQPDDPAWERILSDWSSKQTKDNTEPIEPVFSFSPSIENDIAESPVGPAAKLQVQGSPIAIDFSAGIAFKREQELTWSVWLEGGSTGAIFGKMNDQPYQGVDGIILSDGRLKLHWIASWPENAIAVIAKSPLTAGRWYHVTVTYDGSSKASGIKIYIDGRSVDYEVEHDSLSDAIDHDLPFQIGQRRNSVFFSGRMRNYKLYDSALNAQQVSRQWKNDLLAIENRTAIFRHYMERLATRELQQQVDVFTRKQKKLLASQQTTMIMKEREGYRETFRLNRGQYDQPDQSEKLWPAIPAALPALTEDQPANRLGLAKWLIDERNPLVARVIVNREWARFFGRGLVDTPDNFGLQGAPPSHPELLDWLADDFRRHGWDYQRLQKQILLSSAYQQSSKADPVSIENDRENRWVARGPRHRLSAEQIRDHALAISGLLVDEVGGPSVFPYQPAGLWEELAGGANNGPYKQSHGQDLYRRTLYTYRKRTVPHPVTSTMDAPGWEICQVKRARTNTPLQALALLNDPTYVEAARAFAHRLFREGGDDLTQQLALGFRYSVGRSATEQELDDLRNGYTEYLKYYSEKEADAQSLLQVGEYRGDCAASTAQQAALATVAAVLLNMDETISKQ